MSCGCFWEQWLLDSSVMNPTVMGQSPLIGALMGIRGDFMVTWKINNSIKTG